MAYRLTAAEFISSGLTVEQYAVSLLDRIKSRDDAVQAWAYLDPEYVLAQARELDKVPKEKRGPLHGAPIGVKDTMYTKDMPTQYNSPIYENHAPVVDSGPVTILRDAGALIFGKTTTAEFAAVFTGPKTRNPHDPNRTPGGSSSGSGAAVGDFQVPIALGTQTIGSVIRPGSYNGVFAFKPTWGSISREGVKISSLILDTIGFFARSVADLQLLADAFKLSDDREPSTFELKGAKVAVCKTHIWPQVGQGTVNALEQAAKLLREHGAEVEELELPEEFSQITQWLRNVLDGDGGISFLPEYNLAKDKLDPYLLGFVENSTNLSKRDYLTGLDGIASLRPKIDAIAGRYAAILTPSVHDEAPEGISNTGSAAFCGMWTALHVPVVNIPGFAGSHGMPIGVSLVAPRYRDRHLLNVSQVVGKAFAADGRNPVS
ncbi:glutamyl-tRNA amidotransferase subunit A [Desarmillaria tabescens]|uniref:Glutamyl-tRNA amidotransferase subunit A n=1 Tax=Armillaria tabescens TaxID=1929756 RepID=A0AA39NMG8_ARMTA|nr:glutamyl-tRNA amidotransferase subunit A [Desarmillaria tabescens]KAK0468370.1 glutamyl-tRNA amidotransferase subunit A [Desarmillaria tabescens]